MSHIAPPSTLKPGSRVWCYLRDSGGADQEQSTLQQRNEIEAYCQEYGLLLVRSFEDAARSGGSTKARAAFLEMIEASMEQNKPDGLLVWNFARFARDMEDSTFYRAVLRRRGLIIHSLTDPIPPGDFSKIMEVFIDYANEEKRKQTSRDVKRGLADRTRKGFAPGGPPPRGYVAEREETGIKRDGKPRMGTRWVPDPELAALVRLAFKMRAEGRSLSEIMTATHGRLYESKNCFSTFFSNKSYLGIGTCGDLVIENHHPALIDWDTWQAVRKVQDDASRNTHGNLLHHKRVNFPSLLSGLAVCIHCGSPIVKDSSTKNGYQYNSYLCGKKRARSSWHACEGKHINAARADKAVIDTVLTRVLTPDFVEDLLAELQAQLSNSADLERQERDARQALGVCERAIERLIDTIETTDSPAASKRLQEREIDKARLHFELSTLKINKEAAQIVVTPEALKLVLAVWAGEIEDARKTEDVRNLQSLLRQFVTKIELGQATAKIWYTYPINAFVDYSVKMGKSSGPLVSYRVITKALFISWSKS
jgi:DNA invertase Pin-like site-specific DNA recombinase